MQEQLQIPVLDLEDDPQEPNAVEGNSPTPLKDISDLPKEKDLVKISFKGDGIRVRLQDRTRNRMKLQIKFSATEAEAFRTYCNALKDDSFHMDDFVKFLFMKGCDAFTKEVMSVVKKAEENPEILDEIEEGIKQDLSLEAKSENEQSSNDA